VGAKEQRKYFATAMKKNPGLREGDLQDGARLNRFGSKKGGLENSTKKKKLGGREVGLMVQKGRKKNYHKRVTRG